MEPTHFAGQAKKNELWRNDTTRIAAGRDIVYDVAILMRETARNRLFIKVVVTLSAPLSLHASFIVRTQIAIRVRSCL